MLYCRRRKLLWKQHLCIIKRGHSRHQTFYHEEDVRSRPSLFEKGRWRGIDADALTFITIEQTLLPEDDFQLSETFVDVMDSGPGVISEPVVQLC